MKTNRILHNGLFIIAFSIVSFISANGQRKFVSTLNDGFQKKPFGARLMPIQRDEYNTAFIDSTKFHLLRKSVIHFQPYQYIWQNYKAGLYTYDSLKKILPVCHVDTSKLSPQVHYGSIFLVWLIDKKNNDTIIALNNRLEPFDKWKIVPLKEINNFDLFHLKSTSPVYQFAVQIFSDSLINMHAYLRLALDTLQSKYYSRLQVLSNLYTHGKININGKAIHLSIGIKYLDHFFSNNSAKIKLEGLNSGNNNDNQVYSIGDTIHVNGYAIKFLNISANGHKLEWQNIGKLNKNSTGFNTGYKYTPIFNKDLVTDIVIDSDNILKNKNFILIDFWGTWCGPCIAAIPHTRKIYEKYKQDIEIISVASERSLDTPKVLNAINKYQMPWMNIIVDYFTSEQHGSILYKYRIDAYPSFLLIDDKGRIVLRKIGYTKLDSLEKTLKQRLQY